jgi:hypothetical protein
MWRHVHLVGSVPLSGARDVFAAVSKVLGPHLKRIPDGETGERSDWITWLEPIFANDPALEKSDEVFRVHAGAKAHTRYRLKPGRSVNNIAFENLFYADIAGRSFAEFAALKRQGIVPKSCRFQIDLVPAHSVLWLFLQDDLQRPVAAAQRAQFLWPGAGRDAGHIRGNPRRARRACPARYRAAVSLLLWRCQPQARG